MNEAPSFKFCYTYNLFMCGFLITFLLNAQMLKVVHGTIIDV